MTSQGGVIYACLCPEVAASTGSLRCSSEFNSATPACLLGVSYSECQDSFEAIIWPSSLDEWEDWTLGSALHHVREE